MPTKKINVLRILEEIEHEEIMEMIEKREEPKPKTPYEILEELLKPKPTPKKEKKPG